MKCFVITYRKNNNEEEETPEEDETYHQQFKEALQKQVLLQFAFSS